MNHAMYDLSSRHFSSRALPAAARVDETVDTELSHRAAEGAWVGGAIGGSLGAIATAVAAAAAAITVPGLDIVIAEPALAALFGAAAGIATGGLVGALIGWGIPVERLKRAPDAGSEAARLAAEARRSAADAAYLEWSWKNSHPSRNGL